MGAVFQAVPSIMLCKPSLVDRWDRRAVELAAYLHLHGHCNVPEVCARPLLPSYISACLPNTAAGVQ